MTKETEALEILSTNSCPQKERPVISELMKAHLEEIAGGLAGHQDWNSKTVCLP